jgi:hypothetical protein
LSDILSQLWKLTPAQVLPHGKVSLLHWTINKPSLLDSTVEEGTTVWNKSC